MSPLRNAVLSGSRRGRLEFGKSLRAPEDIGYYVIGNAVYATVLWANRDNEIAGTGMPLALFMVPGVLAFIILFTAAYGLATAVTTEREDGTLLRMKSVPHGMTGYVAGQVTRTAVEALFGVVLTLVIATVVVPGLWGGGGAQVAGTVLAVTGLVLLALLACIPLGLAIGSVFTNPRSVGGWGFLVMGGLVAVSGLFIPFDALPGWAQAVGRVTPLYWLGVGMREAVLPAEALTAIGEGDRTPLAVAVLVVWAVVGLALAPTLLRRMARRESGATVAARQQKVLQRV
ncbi:ABC transporter permease [Thalassiella azotivora]